MVTEDIASLQYSQSCYNVTAHCQMDNINCCAQTNNCPCSVTFSATLEQLSVYSFCLIKHANILLTHWIYHVQNFHVAQMLVNKWSKVNSHSKWPKSIDTNINGNTNWISVIQPISSTHTEHSMVKKILIYEWHLFKGRQHCFITTSTFALSIRI